MKETIAAVLNILQREKLHITFAESCTGGLLAASLVNMPAASTVLDESYVTYANQAKMRLCGVRAETLEKCGAVSECTVKEMAEGAARRAGAQVAVAVSGIAGPTGGTEEKPVGTVCFGFYLQGKTVTKTAHFAPVGRCEVRRQAVQFAWQELHSLLICMNIS